MVFLLVLPVRMLIAILQRLPLLIALRLGRGAGMLGWWVLRRHRRVALENLAQVFGAEMSRSQILALAREHFRRLGENYVCGIWTSGRSTAELGNVLEIGAAAQIPRTADGPPNLVFVTGHFGNFELCGRVQAYVPGWQIAVTYRALKPEALNKILQDLRGGTGVRIFERTREAGALRQLLARGGIALGLLADQHAGSKGLWLPFFGRPCSTSAAPVVLAQRYQGPLQMLLCFRVRLGKWRVEFGPKIRTREADGSPRDAAEIMRDVNACYEVAIRRDPANWFWVHRRWKPPSERQLLQVRGGPGTGTLSEEM